MNNQIFVTVVLFLLTNVNYVSAQKDDYDNNRQLGEAEKVAFINKNLKLSSKESQAFWLVYNDFSKKMDSSFHEEHKILEKDMSKMTDAEVEAELNKLIKLMDERTTLILESVNKYNSIIGARKVLMLRKIERDFRKYLLTKAKAEQPAQK